MQEESELLSAIGRGAISSSGMFMISLSPQSILKMGDQLIEQAATRQSLCLNVKTDPVPPGYLDKIGERLKQWRSRFGVKVSTENFHETNYPLHRLSSFEPDFIRLPAPFIGHAGFHDASSSPAGNMAKKVIAMIVLLARNEGIDVIITDIATEDERKKANLLGATHLEGPLIASEYGDIEHFFSVENMVFAMTDCDRSTCEWVKKAEA